MKNIFIVLSIICAINVNVSKAQEMRKGMSLFNAGMGIFPGWGINASYDFGLVDSWGPGIFTIGCYVGYGNWTKSELVKPSNTKFDYRVRAFAFAPRATYRYAVNSSFEIYGTVMFGATAYSYSEFYNNESGNFFAVTAGCRYSLFNSNFAVFAEIGNLVSYLNGGLSYSF